jgi:hypothetical protein
MGTPDGGPYDEAPPIFLTSTPASNATNASENKITLEFDEFIKLQNAYEKIVVSPPQMQQPEIKANGKRITVELLDSLKPSTTYTIDFNDAIADNNESNALEAFSFVFSTGATVDTLGVSGTVLEASNLEPIKGILVGIHSDLSDSAFRTKPFDRISRTDSRGRFTMRGMAPGKYRIYALADANGNVVPTEIAVPQMREHSSEEGVLAYDVPMPEQSLIVAVSSKDDVEVVGEDTRLFPGDSVVIASDRDKVADVRAVFREL